MKTYDSFSPRKDLQSLIAFLETMGIGYEREKTADQQYFVCDGILFRVAYGTDWECSRWQCDLSHVDRALRQWQGP